jgi:chemotaxis protein CheC
MVGSQVGLKVPVVEILEAEGAARSLTNFSREGLIAVRQAFAGRLSGQTMLLLSPADGETLARAVIGDGYSDEEYQELRGDTLGEIGNVLLLGLLATIGSMLGVRFEVDIPTVTALDASEIFPTEDGRVVMLIDVDFSVRYIDARGYFALVLGLGGLSALHEIISGFLAEILDAAATKV